MVRLVLEITEKERKALQKSGKEVKRLFKRIGGAFKFRVVEQHKKKK